MKNDNWYLVKDAEACITPSLMVYPDRVGHNIQEMIRIAGEAGRLRPHIKTHKMAEIIAMQLAAGIEKFKCATIAEAELLAKSGATDVLLALQPVGRNMDRLFELMTAFPDTHFSTIVDDAGIARQLNQMAAAKGLPVGVYMDLNVGMDRTGIPPGKAAGDLYQLIDSLDHLKTLGLHVYDGHIRDSGLEARTTACDTAFGPVLDLKSQLEQVGLKVPAIVAGGSPSFPVHARRKGVELSPGTTLLWDERYGSSFPDMEFLPAAVLLCRIISKPAKDLLCLDLGHKAIAPEMPFPRVRLLGMEDCEQLSQSEEHLVLRCKNSSGYALGDICYAIPVHICPTVAKYPKVYTVSEGRVSGSWSVAARDHQLTI